MDSDKEKISGIDTVVYKNSVTVILIYEGNNLTCSYTPSLLRATDRAAVE